MMIRFVYSFDVCRKHIQGSLATAEIASAGGYYAYEGQDYSFRWQSKARMRHTISE